MLIYYILIFEILILGSFMKVSYNSKWHKVYCSIIGFTLFIISALRGISVGGDSWNYARLFNITITQSYENILLSGTRDIGYVIFVKTIGLFTTNHQWLFVLVAALFAVSISIYIYSYSKDPMLSYLVVLSFSFFQFSMTGLRQTIAMSILLIAIKAALDRKILKFLFIVFIASLFHKSAWFFLIVYPMTFIKIKMSISLLGILVLATTQALRFKLVQLFISISNSDSYSYFSGGGGETMLLVLSLLFLFGLLFQKSYKKTNESAGFDYMMMFMGVFFQILTPVQNIFFRIAMYFTLSLVSYIPRLIKAIPNFEIRTIVNICMYVVLLIQYFFFTINAAYVTPYMFYWQ